MKPKTARRFLARNQHRLMEARDAAVKKSDERQLLKREAKCLKALREVTG